MEFAAATTTADTIFSSSATPANASNNGGAAVELGVKFESSEAGYIDGVRFYKGTSNTGTHVGYLWSSTGTLLASATFTNETASGWQQVNFATPVAIAANTVYVASYLSPTGYFAYNNNYFTSTVTNGPLTAPASSTVGGNGVYLYGTSGGFPTSSYQASNYWVDVAFSPSVSGSSLALGAGGLNTPSIPNVTAPMPTDPGVNGIVLAGSLAAPESDVSGDIAALDTVLANWTASDSSASPITRILKGLGLGDGGAR